MRILLAPNSFKGSTSAWEIAPAMERGALYFGRIRNVPISTRLFPISDGGTGFRRLISSAHPGAIDEPLEVEGPSGGRRQANISVLPDGTAVIESAEFIGLAITPPDSRNPMRTSSRPLGQAIRHAIRRGYRKILLGCGDSSTCDGGLGLLEALGAKISGEMGRPIVGSVGADLARVTEIDCSNLVLNDFKGTLEVACNLTSVASGHSGTALIYAQQKGAGEAEVRLLDQGMQNYCHLVEEMSGKAGISHLPGSGAAGGVTLPLMCFAKDCQVRYSFEVTFSTRNINEHLSWADIVVTGEGLFDRNSVKGKAPVALALRAKQFDRTVVAIVGAIEGGTTSRMLRSGIDFLEPLSHQSISIDYYSNNSLHLVAEATTRALLQVAAR